MASPIGTHTIAVQTPRYGDVQIHHCRQHANVLIEELGRRALSASEHEDVALPSCQMASAHTVIAIDGNTWFQQHKDQFWTHFPVLSDDHKKEVVSVLTKEQVRDVFAHAAPAQERMLVSFFSLDQLLDACEHDLESQESGAIVDGAELVDFQELKAIFEMSDADVATNAVEKRPAIQTIATLSVDTCSRRAAMKRDLPATASGMNAVEHRSHEQTIATLSTEEPIPNRAKREMPFIL